MQTVNIITQALYQVAACGQTIGQTTAHAYGSGSMALAGAKILAELWAFGMAYDHLKQLDNNKFCLLGEP